jgi:N-methylhydantoinase A
MRVASDVGGTFTDLVFYDQQSGAFGAVKVDTTPPNYEQGVLDSLHKAGLNPQAISFFAHGSTVVINALTERKGVRTGLITTRGFRDVLEIARGNRPDLFNFAFAKPRPFVPRYLRREIGGRMNYKGEELEPLELEAVPELLAFFRREGVEALAICLLHSYANPAHELALLEALHKHWPAAALIASSAISREWREYERSSTAVLSAYILPIAGRYLASLEARLGQEGFGGHLFMMQSNGGIATLEAARANPIAAVESGPASGVLGALALGHLIGEMNLITLDIGGTTAKCSLIDRGQARITTEYKIEWTRTNPGYPIKTPVIDIVEIGNGGGSIAWVDAAGSLHVGPQSAGALPGPACYGRGGSLPTTTDANLLAGKIDRENFLGGEIRPDMANVERAFEQLAAQLGSSSQAAVRGVIRIANANMVNALKLVSLNRGYDPRDFTLIAFGGGGAMHAAELAEELGIPRVLVPINPAVFSAWGMLMTDLRRDYLRTRVTRLDSAAPEALEALFGELEIQAHAEFAADGLGPERLSFQRFADMRYLGQEHTVKVALPASIADHEALAQAAARFHEAHEREYTFRLASPVELVNYHLVAYGLVEKPTLPRLPASGRRADELARGSRLVDFDTRGQVAAPIYDRAALEPGMRFAGPAIVEEPATTIVVLPGQHVTVDDFGNLHIALTHGEKR